MMGDVPPNPSGGAGPTDEMKARVAAERAGRPFLLFRDGEDRQQLFCFEPGSAQVSVGRLPSSDLVLGWDDSVSRRHARFERAGNDWAVADDGPSRNGTFVNGERIRGRRLLKDGDSVRFGSTTTTFRSPHGEADAGVGAAPVVELSSTQRRVLAALCGPYEDGGGSAAPAGDEEIAEELFLSVGAVRTHLAVLFAKFGIQELPPDQRRVRLVEQAFSTGVVSEGHL